MAPAQRSQNVSAKRWQRNVNPPKTGRRRIWNGCSVQGMDCLILRKTQTNYSNFMQISVVCTQLCPRMPRGWQPVRQSVWTPSWRFCFTSCFAGSVSWSSQIDWKTFDCRSLVPFSVFLIPEKERLLNCSLSLGGFFFLANATAHLKTYQNFLFGCCTFEEVNTSLWK